MEVAAPRDVACHHKKAAEELAKGQLYMVQLRALMLLEDWADVPAVLLEQAVQSSNAALSMLQPCGCMPSRKRSSPSPELEQGAAIAGMKKRKTSGTVISVTTAPHFDGYQWRKYGQKFINNAKFPRSYYRCTHFKEQGCLATKTVQQKDDSEGDLAEFVVAYKMHHTCKPTEASSAFVVESSHEQKKTMSNFEPSRTADESNGSTIARQCSSDSLPSEMDSSGSDVDYMWNTMPDFAHLMNENFDIEWFMTRSI
ncbi:hypothetical protein HPP92_022585 [Vanilla planifolia]|uniref:WRKY domain-containing protein n=1 Tax=Vanilla planifolia TaxID=51239 RepID=A0A835UE11_VANPL|nr:hypothetical protein HPP92_022862 [Vanilla planifolia]KAG0459457.1 hypothetical protein HPP92_022585 [Vanilla planifolia]